MLIFCGSTCWFTTVSARLIRIVTRWQARDHGPCTGVCQLHAHTHTAKFMTVTTWYRQTPLSFVIAYTRSCRSCAITATTLTESRRQHPFNHNGANFTPGILSIRNSTGLSNKHTRRTQAKVKPRASYGTAWPVERVREGKGRYALLAVGQVRQQSGSRRLRLPVNMNIHQAHMLMHRSTYSKYQRLICAATVFVNNSTGDCTGYSFMVNDDTDSLCNNNPQFYFKFYSRCTFVACCSIACCMFYVLL